MSFRKARDSRRYFQEHPVRRPFSAATATVDPVDGTAAPAAAAADPAVPAADGSAQVKTGQAKTAQVKTAPAGFTRPNYAAGHSRPIAKYRSPVVPAFVSGVAGLLLVGVGVFLAAKFGFAAAAAQIETGRTAFNQVVLTGLGGVLLLGAVALNGRSSWATLVPGLLLTGVGGWAFENPAGLHTAAKWTQTVFADNQMSSWHLVGFTFVLGLVLLGASAGASIARRSN